MNLDLHIHSKYSYDSFTGLKSILKISKRRGIQVISITDHNTMEAYNELQKFPKQDDILIIPGMEIKTELGDIIGLFLQNEIKSRTFIEVIDEIDEQDGVSVLPHPYRRGCDPVDLALKVDLVETFNARSTNDENWKAQELCDRVKKVPITGSDAHLCLEVGRAITQININVDDVESLKKIILKSERRCKGIITPYFISHGSSFFAARLKRLGKI
jgi:predicted metal-dependent phosphoesterase TrpH